MIFKLFKDICKVYFSSYFGMVAFSFRHHCVKSVQIRSYFWSVFSCIQSEYRKIRTTNNSVFGHFSRCLFQRNIFHNPPRRALNLSQKRLLIWRNSFPICKKQRASSTITVYYFQNLVYSVLNNAIDHAMVLIRSELYWVLIPASFKLNF